MPISRQFTKRNFYWELLAILAQRGQLGPLPVDVPVARRQVALEPTIVKLPHEFRHENSQWPPNQLSRIIAKDSRGCGVGELNCAIVVHADNRIVGRFDYQAMLFFATSQIFLGVLAIGNFLSQVFVGRGKFRSSLRDASIELAREMLLFVQEPRPLQPD